MVTAGSNVNIKAIEPYADAILLAWYPGEQGGNALADIIFGNISPAGRLPVTFYEQLQDLPDYADYAMKNRTYRYFTGKVQYPFGFGLSYTTFDYTWKKQPQPIKSANDTLEFSVTVKNTGAVDADEVVQVYIQYPGMERMPVKELKGFSRVYIKKASNQTIQFRVPAKELQKWDLYQHTWKLYPGNYTIAIGSSSEDIKLKSTINIKAGIK